MGLIFCEGVLVYERGGGMKVYYDSKFNKYIPSSQIGYYLLATAIYKEYYKDYPYR